MADVNKPDHPSEAVKTVTPSNVNGTAPATGPLAQEPAHPARPSELTMQLRWFAGLVIALVCGWGLIAGTLYLCMRQMKVESGTTYVFVFIAAVVSLALFLGMEYKHWLTHLMGLHPFTSDPYGVKSGLFFWVTGVLGLLFRSTVTADPAAEAEAASRPTSAPDTPQQTDGIREIIETVVFVVVLVLLLKSFAAEAFVIPTGSMAETLYGYQRIVTCPQCGREFPVNCSNEVDPSPDNPATKITGCTCPGCRYLIDFAQEEKNNPNYRKPDWNSGDRVLVAKFLYELFNKKPNRLDVVVFKYPGDSKDNGGRKFPATGPMKNHTPMNYIKRLIGLPGETIAIHRGKLYVLPPGSGVEFDDWKHLQDLQAAAAAPGATQEQKNAAEELRITLWQHRYMYVNDATALKLFEQEQFQIIRKPPETMLAVRRLVYNNDQQAKDLKGVLPPRWAGDSDDWKEDGTGFKIDGGDNLQWLRYRHYLRDTPHAKYSQMTDALSGKGPARSLITDFMGYNFYEPHPGAGKPSENWVGDLMIECDVTVDKTEGEMVLELRKSNYRYQLHWNLATGDMNLYRFKGYEDGKLEKEDLVETRKATQPKKGSTYKLRFSNFDDRLTVWVDNALPFDDGVTYKGSKQEHAAPVKENDLVPANIGVKGGSVTVRNLSLYRDTYYTATVNSPTSADADGVDFGSPSSWGNLGARMPIMTLYVQPEHFLCLGDNSPESSDGRTWGLVPERLLLGRAMLVYFPFKFPYWPLNTPVNRVGRIR